VLDTISYYVEMSRLKTCAPGPLPPQPGPAVCHGGSAGTGPCCADHGSRDVPRHGHDVLAARGGGSSGTGGGQDRAAMTALLSPGKAMARSPPGRLGTVRRSKVHAGVAGVIGSFFTVVEVAKIITL
jgi:hypothetical protein